MQMSARKQYRTKIDWRAAIITTYTFECYYNSEMIRVKVRLSKRNRQGDHCTSLRMRILFETTIFRSRNYEIHQRIHFTLIVVLRRMKFLLIICR